VQPSQAGRPILARLHSGEFGQRLLSLDSVHLSPFLSSGHCIRTTVLLEPRKEATRHLSFHPKCEAAVPRATLSHVPRVLFWIFAFGSYRSIAQSLPTSDPTREKPNTSLPSLIPIYQCPLSLQTQYRWHGNRNRKRQPSSSVLFSGEHVIRQVYGAVARPVKNWRRFIPVNRLLYYRYADQNYL